MAKRRVLLLGWDAADWKLINPLMDAGLMPALDRLVNRGVIGNLATLDPPLSPMLWTSIATGMTADRHGVLGFTQPGPAGKGVRPVLSTSRRTKAVWNMLMQSGLRTNLVGWWPSHPAEKLNGACVSNFYQRATTTYDKPWTLPPDCIQPEGLRDELAALRVHPGELTDSHILPFVPDMEKVDQDKDRRLGAIAKIVAETAGVHGAATWLMENTEWDFMAVYYDMIDHMGHGFMAFHPPRRSGVPSELYDIYKSVMAGAYRFQDMMLDRMLALAGPDTTVIVLSDHGFHSDHLRPRAIPKEPAGPAIEHRQYGIICMAGPDIRQDERIYGAGLLDIAPTILHLFGLPVGFDMAGKPLLDAFDSPQRPEYIPTWQDVDGDDGMHPEDARSDPWAEQQAMQQLIDLGYIDAPAENEAETVARTMRESRYYLARVFMSTSRPAEALPILEELAGEFPDQRRYGLFLTQCYLDLNRVAEAGRLVEAIVEREEKSTPAVDVLRGSIFVAEGNMETALECFERAEASDPMFPMLHRRLGNVYLSLGRSDDAQRAYLRALTIDPDSPESHYGLAVAFMQMERWELAAEAALRAIGLRFYFPYAHLRLGRILMQLGQYERAATAFEVCLSQAPGVARAHFWLSELYRNYLDEPAKAARHMQAYADAPEAAKVEEDA